MENSGRGLNYMRFAFTDEVHGDDFSNFANARNDWNIQEIQFGPDDDVDEDRPKLEWNTPSGTVRHVDDTILGCQYVEFDEEDDQIAINAVRSAFSCIDRSQAVAAIDLGQAKKDVRRRFRLLACLAPGEFDGDVFDVTIRGLQSPRDDIRRSALVVPQYTKWVQFLPDVTQVNEGDSNAAVRRVAGGIRVLLEYVSELE